MNPTAFRLERQFLTASVPGGKLSGPTRKAVEREAERLAAYLGGGLELVGA